MLHKPTYCCNCGDKVERVEWHIWNSRRFCELCETEFQFDEWWPRVAVFIILVFGFTGIGFHFGADEKEPGVSIEAHVPPKKRLPFKAVNSNIGNTAVVPTSGTEPKLPADRPAQTEPADGSGQQVPSPEIAIDRVPQEIYYCGALTKKGTPCARRVKDGGRCWQHKNQPSN